MERNVGLIVWLSIVAGLSSLSAASVLADVLGDTGSALFAAIIAACNTGTAVYVAAVRPLVGGGSDSGARQA